MGPKNVRNRPTLYTVSSLGALSVVPRCAGHRPWESSSKGHGAKTIGLLCKGRSAIVYSLFHAGKFVFHVVEHTSHAVLHISLDVGRTFSMPWFTLIYALQRHEISLEYANFSPAILW